ncbi:23S rRNA (adenine(2030)-N(6))-methyltransferase RlmJ [Thiofilum flexile]|uniref:23S rRNA (adenine(2030)-N(6))-methyltransferase RlmJ n=1 Tax=Thiofilum flexile TaxID=125627 RepID=UPI000380522A|nr:23S rRNA (adenine(2030)-N(6))-methyltransferase RlmJ [Thiofilum flexile]
MLSYRHAFHAGNHADILKHATLTLMLSSLNQKPKPYYYIDTHAGAGLYRLDSGWSNKTGEAALGIQKLWPHRARLPQLKTYFDCIQALNRGETIIHYPGSPWIAQTLVRSTEHLVLIELHPDDKNLIKSNLNQTKQTTFVVNDGFQELIARVPPSLKRGLVLIDPPYELKQDYQRVTESLAEAYKRWATGVYAVWYPILANKRDHSDTMLRKIKQGAYSNLLKVELKVMGAQSEFGMHGSGMLIVNAPWQLDRELKTILPTLTDILALDNQASWSVEWLKEPS